MTPNRRRANLRIDQLRRRLHRGDGACDIRARWRHRIECDRSESVPMVPVHTRRMPVGRQLMFASWHAFFATPPKLPR